MEKQIEEKFRKDEEQDFLLVKEVLGKEKSLVKAAAVLTQKLQQKYGSEFGGVVKLDFDVIEKRFTLACGRDYSIEMDENDLEDIPVRIKMFREQMIEDRNKPKPSVFHKEDKNKQKLRTEDGSEIKVPIKDTANAEKEMMEEDEDEDDS